MDALKKSSQKSHAHHKKTKSPPHHPALRWIIGFGMACIIGLLWYASFKANLERFNSSTQNSEISALKENFNEALSQTNIFVETVKSLPDSVASSTPTTTKQQLRQEQIIQEISNQINTETN